MQDFAADEETSPAFRVQGADLVKLYGDVCAGIRDTDQVSFKILGFIPVISGGGAVVLTYLLDNLAIGPIPIAALGILGAFSTFAVYRWELRNIQTCNRMWERAKVLEERLGFGPLAGRQSAPPLLRWPVGKTQAERLLYSASIVAWFVPIVLAVA